MSKVLSDLLTSCEATDFPKITFLSTSPLVLFQLVEFNPRWEFRLQPVFLGRPSHLPANSRNNLKLCFSLNEIVVVQETIEAPILTIAPLLDQL